VNDGNMEEGSLRCDANLSIRRKGDPLGVKTEIKNLNSFRNVERGLVYEIARQIERKEGGEPIVQETRLYDAGRDVTFPMRSKEEAHDYRYFPDPDLKPVLIDQAWLSEVAAGLPELPGALEQRLEAEFGLPSYDARVLASTRDLAAYFEEAAGISGDGKLASNWVMTEVMRLLKEENASLADLKVTAKNLGAMLRSIATGGISGKIGKVVFEEMARTGRTPEEIIEELGLSQISDPGEIDLMVADVLSAHPGPVEDYRKGKEASLQFLIGQAMKASRGRAEPKLLRERLMASLSENKKETEKH
jgi:aspartyl-tRNA(Asn)/glutamyl-tRNA(Gln) amidotransferase subunit B